MLIQEWGNLLELKRGWLMEYKRNPLPVPNLASVGVVI